MVSRPCTHNVAPAGRTGRHHTRALSRATAARSGPALPPHTVRQSSRPPSPDCGGNHYDCAPGCDCDTFDDGRRVRPTIHHNARRKLPASAPGRSPHALRCGPPCPLGTRRRIRPTPTRIFPRHDLGPRRGPILLFDDDDDLDD